LDELAGIAFAACGRLGAQSARKALAPSSPRPSVPGSTELLFGRLASSRLEARPLGDRPKCANQVMALFETYSIPVLLTDQWGPAELEDQGWQTQQKVPMTLTTSAND
jgi:hypothetical protein